MFNVRGTGAPTVINTGSGINTINVGSSAPSPLDITDLIQGLLTVNGNSMDTLNVDDTGSTGLKTGMLTATLTGLGMTGGIVYSNIALLNVSLGIGGNTFTIASTNGTTFTMLNSGYGNDTVNLQTLAGSITVNTGQGTNTINIGSLAPTLSGGVVSGIQGILVLNGSGADTLNLDDTGNMVDHQFTLTDTTFSRDGMATITYATFEALNIALGSGKNTFTINNLNPATVTTINGIFLDAAQSPLLFDIVSGDLQGLAQILGALNNLTVDAHGNLTGT